MHQTKQQNNKLMLVLAVIAATLAACLFWVANAPVSPAIERMEKSLDDSRIPR